MREMQRAAALIDQHGDGDSAKARELMIAYRAGYLSRTNAKLDADFRTASWAVVGPAGFNVRRNRKRMDVAHARLVDLVEYTSGLSKRIRRAYLPEGVTLSGAITSDADNAVELLEEKLADLVATQERMKKANRILRSKRPRAAKVEALKELRLTEAFLDDVDVFGNPGFAKFKLTNNGARIRATKKRIEAVKTERANPELEYRVEAAGLSVHDDPETNRIRLDFDAKPAPEVITKLKRNGFKWSRRDGVWQRQRTNAARWTVKSLGWGPPPTMTKAEVQARVRWAIERVNAIQKPMVDMIARTAKTGGASTQTQADVLSQIIAVQGRFKTQAWDPWIALAPGDVAARIGVMPLEGGVFYKLTANDGDRLGPFEAGVDAVVEQAHIAYEEMIKIAEAAPVEALTGRQLIQAQEAASHALSKQGVVPGRENVERARKIDLAIWDAQEETRARHQAGGVLKVGELLPMRGFDRDVGTTPSEYQRSRWASEARIAQRVLDALPVGARITSGSMHLRSPEERAIEGFSHYEKIGARTWLEHDGAGGSKTIDAADVTAATPIIEHLPEPTAVATRSEKNMKAPKLTIVDAAGDIADALRMVMKLNGRAVDPYVEQLEAAVAAAAAAGYPDLNDAIGALFARERDERRLIGKPPVDVRAAVGAVVDLVKANASTSISAAAERAHEAAVTAWGKVRDEQKLVMPDIRAIAMMDKSVKRAASRAQAAADTRMEKRQAASVKAAQAEAKILSFPARKKPTPEQPTPKPTGHPPPMFDGDGELEFTRGGSAWTWTGANYDPEMRNTDINRLLRKRLKSMGLKASVKNAGTKDSRIVIQNAGLKVLTDEYIAAVRANGGRRPRSGFNRNGMNGERAMLTPEALSLVKRIQAIARSYGRSRGDRLNGTTTYGYSADVFFEVDELIARRLETPESHSKARVASEIAALVGQSNAAYEQILEHEGPAVGAAIKAGRDDVVERASWMADDWKKKTVQPWIRALPEELANRLTALSLDEALEGVTGHEDLTSLKAGLPGVLEAADAVIAELKNIEATVGQTNIKSRKTASVIPTPSTAIAALPSPRDAQDAAGLLGDAATSQILGGRGLSGASAAELNALIAAAKDAQARAGKVIPVKAIRRPATGPVQPDLLAARRRPAPKAKRPPRKVAPARKMPSSSKPVAEVVVDRTRREAHRRAAKSAASKGPLAWVWHEEQRVFATDREIASEFMLIGPSACEVWTGAYSKSGRRVERQTKAYPLDIAREQLDERFDDSLDGPAADVDLRVLKRFVKGKANQPIGIVRRGGKLYAVAGEPGEYTPKRSVAVGGIARFGQDRSAGAVEIGLSAGVDDSAWVNQRVMALALASPGQSAGRLRLGRRTMHISIPKLAERHAIAHLSVLSIEIDVLTPPAKPASKVCTPPTAGEWAAITCKRGKVSIEHFSSRREADQYLGAANGPEWGYSARVSEVFSG